MRPHPEVMRHSGGVWADTGSDRCHRGHLPGFSRERVVRRHDNGVSIFESQSPRRLRVQVDSATRRQLGEQLVSLGDSVKADEVLARLKNAQQDGLRGLRDRLDLYEDGATIIKFGRHRFSVNTQPLELTMVPRGEGMALRAMHAPCPGWAREPKCRRPSVGS